MSSAVQGPSVAFDRRPSCSTSTLAALYHRFEPRVRNVMFSRGVEPAVIDDLVHETFVQIHRRWPTRGPDVPLGSWVSGVASNVAFVHRRKEARRRQRLDEYPAPVGPSAPDEIAAGVEAWRALQGFLSELSPKLREAFVLVDVGGASVGEIASALGIRPPTLRSRLRLARHRFSEHFAMPAERTRQRALLREAAAKQTPAHQREALAIVLLDVPRGVAPLLGLGLSSPLVWAGSFVGGGLAAGAALGATVLFASPKPGPQVQSQRAVARSAVTPETKSGLPLRAPESNPDVPGLVHAAQRVSPAPAQKTTFTQRKQPGTGVDSLDSRELEPKRTRNGDEDASALAVHLTLLAEARGLVHAGKHREALRLLNGPADPPAQLVRDHRRLQRSAACGAGDVQAAERALDALRSLGLRDAEGFTCSAGS